MSGLTTDDNGVVVIPKIYTDEVDTDQGSATASGEYVLQLTAPGGEVLEIPVKVEAASAG